MKAKIKFLMAIALLICVVFCAISFYKRKSINENLAKALNIDLEKFKINKTYFKRLQFTDEGSLPFNIYIGIETDSTTAMKIVNELKMIPFDSYNSNDCKRMLCINYHKPERFWQMRSLYFEGGYSQEIDGLKWWRPNIDDLRNCFAANYQINYDFQGGKSTLCEGQIDGRIVSQYVSDMKTLYILIECFLR